MAAYPEEYILRGNFMEVALSPLGAALRSVSLKSAPFPGRNVLVSFAREKDYAQNALYAGATLAPAAGRVKDGLLPLDNTVCQLTRNENAATHLHGGYGSLSFQNWETQSLEASAVSFRAFLAHGVDGYPGNREFSVEYRLENNTLTITQRMTSDIPTYVNLSHHAYYNLNGFLPLPRPLHGMPESAETGCPALLQYFHTDAKQVLCNDDSFIPQESMNSADTAFDFSTRRLLADSLYAHRNNAQLRTAKGYNHYFLLENTLHAPACSLLSFDKRLEMRLFTDAPAFVLYTGGFIGNEYLLRSDDGALLRSYPGCGIAIEPSSLPPSLYKVHGQTDAERTIRLEFRL